MKRKKHRSSFVFTEILKSWWVVAFALFVFAIYEQASGRVTNNITKLQNQKELIEKDIADLEAEQEELRLEVASQNDPAWMEYSLIKGLGLVPEGYTKVYFEDDE